MIKAYAEAYRIPEDEIVKFADEIQGMAERQVRRDLIIDTLADREQQRKAERRAFLEQAKVEQAQREADLERLRRIRDRKVNELLEQGVEERYTVQLAGYKPENVLLKDYKLGGRIPTIN